VKAGSLVRIIRTDNRLRGMRESENKGALFVACGSKQNSRENLMEITKFQGKFNHGIVLG